MLPTVLFLSKARKTTHLFGVKHTNLENRFVHEVWVVNREKVECLGNCTCSVSAVVSEANLCTKRTRNLAEGKYVELSGLGFYCSIATVENG